MKTKIEHTDFLGQPIRIGDHVSFTWSTARGIRVGVVNKLTKQRIKLSFSGSYTHKGVTEYFTSHHITRPIDCLVLSDKLQQHLTLATLQKKI